MALVDFESLSLEGDTQIRIIPDKADRHFYNNNPDGVTFECPFDHTSMDVSHLFTALMLPERKFVRWRKKKMLVSKVYHRATIQMSVPFDLPHVLNRLAL